jgi:PAS domain S-box-containing protein
MQDRRSFMSGKDQASRLVGHAVGNADGLILAMDEAVCDLIHRSRATVIGMSYLQLTHPQDRVRNAISLRALRPDAAPHSIRKRYLRPEGSFVEVHLEVSRLSGAANGGRLVGTVRVAEPFGGVSRPERLQARARQAVDIAARRQSEFGSGLAGDHAWMILLQLYLAEIECRIIRPDEICAILRMPAAVATSWFRALEAKSLIEATFGQEAQQLTALGFSAVERVLDAE